MNPTAINTEVIRILMWIMGPLLAKWGFDEGNATMLIGGLAAVVSVAAWWLYSRFIAMKKVG